MDKQAQVLKMVPPSKRRKCKPLGGVLQIWVTRACENACWGCTQGSNFGGNFGFITIPQFIQACDSLKNYFGIVGLIGGNPTIHPKFTELCSILRDYFPQEKCGLWSNHPRGKGKDCRETFNPSVSNLNMHLDKEAFDEFRRDWPESRPFGLKDDSRHSPPYIAIKDVIDNEEEMWNLIVDCDINKHWSAMIAPFRGELRGYFCEIAAAQAILHQHEDSYPDLGVPVEPGWWKHSMEAYTPQALYHCPACGIPLRARGCLSQENDGVNLVSITHQSIAIPKVKDHKTLIVTDRSQLDEQSHERITNYLGNAKE